MNAKINPEVWNSLSRVQKRALAESMSVDKPSMFHDLGEVFAWVSTLGATAAVVTFATLLLR